MFLENIVEENKFPIVFIGSGITKRYFKDAPDWEDLLQGLWMETGHEIEEYYSIYEDYRNEFNNDYFQINTHLATVIEEEYRKAFYKRIITLPNLSLKEAHVTNTSPFRAAIAHKFMQLTKRVDMEEEIKKFTQLLENSRMIVTTNYDTFIEELLKNKVKVSVGNKGLFESSNGWAELYKIHGSVSEPNSIMISADDYKQMEKSSALVNAKILSSLTESPIIFMGYSLTDKNIQDLLSDFSDNLPFSINEAANLIGVVEFEKGKIDVTQIISEISNLDVHYTKIKTDNYAEIYSKIATIHQGYTPYELSRYQGAFRQIIETKGQQGELKSVLTSFVDLEDLPENLKSKNLVVAFGDARYIYKTPDYHDYLEAYFDISEDFPVEIALNFISKYSPGSSLPIAKFIKQANGGFDERQVRAVKQLQDKIMVRNEKFPGLTTLQDGIQKPSKQIKETLDSSQLNTPLDIYQANQIDNARNRMIYILQNMQRFESADIIVFTRYLLAEVNVKVIEKTEYRKYFFAVSLLAEPKPIELIVKKSK